MARENQPVEVHMEVPQPARTFKATTDEPLMYAGPRKPKASHGMEVVCDLDHGRTLGGHRSTHGVGLSSAIVLLTHSRAMTARRTK
jgi:hypothetical protein